MSGELLSVVRQVAGVLLGPLVAPFQILRGEINAMPVIALGILGALLFFAARTLRGDRTSAVFLASFSMVWVLFNGPFEGPTLVVLSWSHGLTAADMISLTGFMVAGWRLAPALVGR